MPLCIRPEALIRGPILKITSLIVMSLLVSLQSLMMLLSPKLGLEFNLRNPCKAITRFSPTIGTKSDAIDTATRSSIDSNSL